MSRGVLICMIFCASLFSIGLCSARVSFSTQGRASGSLWWYNESSKSLVESSYDQNVTYQIVPLPAYKGNAQDLVYDVVESIKMVYYFSTVLSPDSETKGIATLYRISFDGRVSQKLYSVLWDKYMNLILCVDDVNRAVWFLSEFSLYRCIWTGTNCVNTTGSIYYNTITFDLIPGDPLGSIMTWTEFGYPNMFTQVSFYNSTTVSIDSGPGTYWSGCGVSRPVISCLSPGVCYSIDGDELYDIGGISAGNCSSITYLPDDIKAGSYFQIDPTSSADALAFIWQTFSFDSSRSKTVFATYRNRVLNYTIFELIPGLQVTKGSDCALDCGIRGDCVSGVCSCYEGFYSSDCTVFCNCSTTCSGNGICASDGVSCNCHYSWSGPNCKTRQVVAAPDEFLVSGVVHKSEKGTEVYDWYYSTSNQAMVLVYPQDTDSYLYSYGEKFHWNGASKTCNSTLLTEPSLPPIEIPLRAVYTGVLQNCSGAFSCVSFKDSKTVYLYVMGLNVPLLITSYDPPETYSFRLQNYDLKPKFPPTLFDKPAFCS